MATETTLFRLCSKSFQSSNGMIVVHASYGSNEPMSPRPNKNHVYGGCKIGGLSLEGVLMLPLCDCVDPQKMVDLTLLGAGMATLMTYGYYILKPSST